MPHMQQKPPFETLFPLCATPPLLCDSCIIPCIQIQSICTRYLHTIPNAAWSLKNAQESRPCWMALPLVLNGAPSYSLISAGSEIISYSGTMKYRLIYEFTKVFFIHIIASVAPKVYLHLYLLLGDHLFGVVNMWNFSGRIFNIAVVSGGQTMGNMIVTSQGLYRCWSMYDG